MGSDDKPNILLITIDSLRADYLGIYGSRYNLSPIIDELGKSGIVFKNAFSNAPYTKASFPSILTGTHPYSYGGYHTIKGRPNLPKILNSNGYYTFGIPHLPILSAKFGYNIGFDYFVDPVDFLENSKGGITNLKSFFKSVVSRCCPKVFPSSLLRVLFKYYNSLQKRFSYNVPYIRGEILSKIAIEIIDNILTLHKGPFFGWIHYMDVHYPYKPPFEFLDRNFSKKRINELWYKLYDSINTGNDIDPKDLDDLISLYMGEIKYVDYSIGILVDYLKSRDIWENTLIVLTADHGEEFMEHGAVGHVGKAYYTHIYDELLRVPLIISGGAVPYQSLTINSIADLVCIPQTILDLAGVDYSNIPFEGVSLLDILDTRKYNKPVLSEASLYNKYKGTSIIDPTEKKVRAYRKGDWKIILYDDGKIELFNIKDDPHEQENIASENSDIVRDLTQDLEIYIRSFRYNEKNEAFRLKKAIKNLKLKGKI